MISKLEKVPVARDGVDDKLPYKALIARDGVDVSRLENVVDLREKNDIGWKEGIIHARFFSWDSISYIKNGLQFLQFYDEI